jgi:hypothetical protein
MMLNRGELDGCACSARQIGYMTRNHCPTSTDVRTMDGRCQQRRARRVVGLGFAVTLDPAHNRVLGSAGDARGGAASTIFCVTPRRTSPPSS